MKCLRLAFLTRLCDKVCLYCETKLKKEVNLSTLQLNKRLSKLSFLRDHLFNTFAKRVYVCISEGKKG